MIANPNYVAPVDVDGTNLGAAGRTALQARCVAVIAGWPAADARISVPELIGVLRSEAHLAAMGLSFEQVTAKRVRRALGDAGFNPD